MEDGFDIARGRQRMSAAFSPTPPVRWFYGREQELEKLQHTLDKCGRYVPRAPVTSPHHNMAVVP